MVNGQSPALGGASNYCCVWCLLQWRHHVLENLQWRNTRGEFLLFSRIEGNVEDVAAAGGDSAWAVGRMVDARSFLYVFMDHSFLIEFDG